MSAEFTKDMKKTHTILCPDIFPIHMGLIKEIFGLYGYDLHILKYHTRDIIDTGLKHLHNDMCYPAICMVGQQIHALTCGDYDPDRVALIQFQTGGGCRASNYIWLLRRALENMGMAHVPVLSLSFNKMEKHSGFKLTPVMLLKGMIAILYGDLMMLLSNRTRPYEINPGDTDAMMEGWKVKIVEQFRHNKGLLGRGLAKNLAAMANDFDAIPRDETRKCTKVGIVGEIYVKYSPFGNDGLEKFLAEEGCECNLPGVLAFFQSMFSNAEVDHELYGDKGASGALYLSLGKLVARFEKKIRDALAPHPFYPMPAPFSHLRALGDEVIGCGVKMGEGWLLPAEILELIESGYPNVICGQPFGCLPNHIIGKGVIRTIRDMHPEANICPLDYDASASRVNRENRIKLMLSVAREEENQ